MSFYGDPDELDRLARQIGRYAEHVRTRGSEMAARASVMQWKSVAADRARDVVTGDHRQLDEAAHRLDEAAALLRRHAQEVREAIAKIQMFEREITGWFDSALKSFNQAVREFGDLMSDIAHGVAHWFGGGQPEPPTPPWQDWPHQPSNLPPPGDKRWLEVGAFMRKQGVI
ncbi:MAG: WXG100 family type VII secretion target [Pseudonocardiaceae bacterium]